MTVREWLDVTGWSVRKLAERCGCHENTLHKLMSGQPPNMRTAKAIRDVTGGAVSLDEIADETLGADGE